MVCNSLELASIDGKNVISRLKVIEEKYEKVIITLVTNQNVLLERTKHLEDVSFKCKLCYSYYVFRYFLQFKENL